MQVFKGAPGNAPKFDGASPFWCASHRARRYVETTHHPLTYIIAPCAICQREGKTARIQHWRNTVDDQPLGPRIWWSNLPFIEPRRVFNMRFLPRFALPRGGWTAHTGPWPTPRPLVVHHGAQAADPTAEDLAEMRKWRQP